MFRCRTTDLLVQPVTPLQALVKMRISVLFTVMTLVEVQSAALDGIHRLESPYPIERNDGTWDEPHGHTVSGGNERHLSGGNDRQPGKSRVETRSQSPSRDESHSSQSRGQADSRPAFERNVHPPGQDRDQTGLTQFSNRNGNRSGSFNDGARTSQSSNRNDNRSGSSNDGVRATQSSNRNDDRSGSSNDGVRATQSSNRNDNRSRGFNDGTRSTQSSNRNDNRSGGSNDGIRATQSANRNDDRSGGSNDGTRATQSSNRNGNRSGSPNDGVRNPQSSGGRNDGSVRQSAGQGGSTGSSGRNDGSVRQSAGQGESSSPSRRQNSTTGLPSGEGSDDDPESRRLSGAAKRFIGSSTDLVKGVLPGNVGKHLIPKIEDDSNDQVCYDRVGCFTNKDLLTLPSSFPIEPEKVNTKFLLYSRSNRQNPITIENKGSSQNSRLNQFRQPKPLKILVHGFNENSNETWSRDIKDALLDEEHCNVIIVDWEGGAKTLNYIKAAGNTALVGREISILLQELIKSHQGALRPADIHLIGFSLGGQVVGFAGRHFQKDTRSLIGRITALDAAGPLFDETEVSVSSKDAEYVDAIHTSGGEKILSGQLGIDRPVGHVDFYPNGGKKQPGCGPLDLSCDHFRAPLFFLESIRNKQCRFMSSPCQGGYTAFLEDKCVQRGERGEMGYFSPRARGRGIQVLTTNSKSQFCKGNA